MGIFRENERHFAAQRLNQTPAPIPKEVLDEIIAEFEDVPEQKTIEDKSK